MIQNNIPPEQLWAQQQIESREADYDFWNKKRVFLQEYSQMSQSCIFTVDVYKKRDDFASGIFFSDLTPIG